MTCALLAQVDAREVGLGDVDLGAQLVEVRHADQLAGAGEAARHRHLADLLQLGEDHAVGRRAQHGVVEVHLRLRDLGLELRDLRLVDTRCSVSAVSSSDCEA